MAYGKDERERIFKASYEFYGVTDESLQESVKEFIESNPWSEDHINLVFVYIRTLADYKVISELSGINDIRLRNSLVSSIDRLHKQLFSYRDMDNENEDKNDKMNSLFNPLKEVGG